MSLPYTDLDLKTPSYEDQFLFLMQRKFSLHLISFFRTIVLCFIHLEQKHLYFSFFSSWVRKIQDFFFQLQKKKKVFLYTFNCIFFGSSFLKDTYRGFQNYFIRAGKVPEYTVIAGQRKNGREVAKTTALSTGKNRKITFTNSEGKSRETA